MPGPGMFVTPEPLEPLGMIDTRPSRWSGSPSDVRALPRCSEPSAMLGCLWDAQSPLQF